MTAPDTSAATVGADLLARLASGADRATLQQAIGDGEHNEELAHALAIQLRLDEQAERERALTTLVESMRELAGLDAVEGVLAAIVARTRRLLLADVAYFLSHDQMSGISSMHVSEGILSDAFMSLKVPSGVGITGFIAASRKPSWTADYMTDPRYDHIGEIDSATAEEGLRAVLGVPVLRAGRVVGLLVAADRHRHDYRPQDVELLFALAQHAGVVIENATVHARDRQSLEQLEDSVDALRASDRATKDILALQDRMLSVLMTNGSLQDLAEATRAVLQGTVVIADGGGRELARAGEHQGAVDVEAGWAIELLGPTSGTVGNRPLGSIAHLGPVSSADKDVDGPRQSLVRAGAVGALMITALQADLSSSWDYASSLVGELLRDPHSDEAAIRRTAVAVDIDSLGTVLVAVAGTDNHRVELHREARRLAEKHAGLACELPDSVLADSRLTGAVLLWLPSVAQRPTAEDCAALMSAAVGAPVTVGASRLGAGPDRLAAAVADARDTVRVLIALGRTGRGGDSGDVAPFPTVLANSTPEELGRFVRDALGPLLDYDGDNNTELVATLESVYAGNSNVAAAAEALYVHPNTVHQRLARIDQITGVSWRENDIALQRQLALKVRTLLAHPPREARK